MEPYLSEQLYALFRDLLVKRSGLFYPEHKREDLVHGLGLAMKEGGYPSLSALYADILENNDAWEMLLSHLTIGETCFFRNKPQFDALRKHIVPDLLQRRSAFRSLRIWSAGCATGEEPYSIAMLLTDMIPNIDEWHISILGTDLNPHFLTRAREGLYGNWSFREISAEFQERFFTKERATMWRLAPNIRAMVTFTRLNLIEPLYPLITNGTCALDIILCRNVTIYFGEKTTRQVVDRFYHALAPGGWLIVGHAEPQASIYHQFEVHNFPNTVVYRKHLDAPLFASSTKEHNPSGIPWQTPQNPPVSPTNATNTFGTPPWNFSPKNEATVGSPADTSAWQPPFFSQIPPLPVVTYPETNPVSSSAATPQTNPQTGQQTNSQPATRKSQGELADEFWLEANKELKQGNKQEAETLFRKVLEQRKDHVEAMVALARICADRGEWECSRSLCKSAIEYDPFSLDSHYILAQVHEHENELDQALTEYRRVVFLDRQYVPGLLGMANVWRRIGRTEDARRSYRNALKQLSPLAPSDPVPGVEGTTASELTAFITRQLQQLGQP
jgi:chemotaxis protein methyltransferase CheR